VGTDSISGVKASAQTLQRVTSTGQMHIHYGEIERPGEEFVLNNPFSRQSQLALSLSNH